MVNVKTTQEAAPISFDKRLLKEEGGFTLPEMLVTIMIMVVVLVAIYNLFDTGIRIFSLGNDKIEAIESARFGLGRMEREVRMAYPISEDDTPTHIFFAQSDPGSPYPPESQRITFGNDLNGDRKVAYLPADGPSEIISYYVVDDGENRKLVRSQSGGLPQDVATLGPTGEFKLVYRNNNGVDLCGDVNPSCTSVDESRIQIVQINLVIDEGSPGDPRTQTLTTNVDLRNRG